MDSDGDGDLFLTPSKYVANENEDDDFSFRFGEPLQEKDIEEKIGKTLPQSTRFKNTWAVGVFNRWQNERRSRAISENLGFEKYRSLIPSGTVHFYCTPRQTPKHGIWFLDKAVGHNTLSSIINMMCQSCGIPGKTNHSLRATAATRLYQANTDEQMICEITGHRSEAVRCYKRASDDQRHAASSIVSAVNKKPKCETVTSVSSENAGHEKTSDRPIVFNFNIS